MNAVATKWAPARNNESKSEYLLSELPCAALRARLWQADIDTVGLALKGGFISADQAEATLSRCDFAPRLDIDACDVLGGLARGFDPRPGSCYIYGMALTVHG